jgi:tetratricopeptide (TPR) repeat protein
MNQKKNIDQLRILFQQQQFQLIEKQAVQFKKNNPKNFDVLTILGVTFAQLGKLEKAILYFEQALNAKPDFAQSHNNLANSQRKLGLFHKSLSSYEKALKINPEYTEALNGRGGVLMDLGQIDEAISSFQKAIFFSPDHPEAPINLVYAYVANGDFELAKEMLKELLSKFPRHADAHYQFSRLHRYKEGDANLETLEQILKAPDLSLKEKVLINYALGKGYADLKNYKTAFDHWTKANQFFKKSIGYKFEKDQKVFDIITQYGDLARKHRFNAPQDKNPIFILGMPRSGTSLVEQILSGHSEVFAAGELETLGRNIRQFLLSTKQINNSVLKQISQGYLEDLRRMPTDKALITDKMPLNFKWIGIIRAIFPGAPILHLKRHPMAVCFSNFRNFFRAQGVSFSHDLIDIGRFYIAYDALMQHWDQLYGEAITTVDYEKLTENPKEEIAKLLQVIGLDWQDACLKIEDNKRSVKTVSNTQIRQKIYTKSSEEWQHYEEELAPLKEMLMPILERDGWV